MSVKLPRDASKIDHHTMVERIVISHVDQPTVTVRLPGGKKTVTDGTGTNIDLGMKEEHGTGTTRCPDTRHLPDAQEGMRAWIAMNDMCDTSIPRAV